MEKKNTLGKEEFLKVFHSAIWMTYRKNFGPFENSQIGELKKCTTDTGWGCMIRSGQMLLANTLLYHFFGDNFSLELINKNTEERIKYLSILWEFMDNLHKSDAAFSIGNIMELGLKYGMKPKNWYGPSMIIRILHKLNKKHHPFTGFQTACFPEGTIYKSSILKKACRIAEKDFDMSELCPEKDWVDSVLVMVSFRLGLTTLSPSQYQSIFKLLKMPECTGMLGGQKKSALYFMGYQKDKLIFLDPHVTQIAVESPVELWSQHLTYHFPTPLRLPIKKLDTSIGYGTSSHNEDRFLPKNL